ncbi:MAG: nucleotidyltransferase domain-containing protein [Eubacteriales bacterium]|nr:nucleotidyltransferase domain-containing protein [Eubacteriales bacterium]
MADAHAYMEKMVRCLGQAFGGRLRYVGLQGSYARGEADKNSDLDVMTVLDALTVQDLDAYRAVLAQMGDEPRPCGFLCGEAELRGWNRAELCQLSHETRDVYGRLADFLPAWSAEDVRAYLRTGVGDLYHALCHCYIYSGPQAAREGVPGAYKRVFYLLQNWHYLRTGQWVGSKAALRACLEMEDLRVLETALALRRGEPVDLEEAYGRLLSWCREMLAQLNGQDK